jgi:lysozyme
MKIIDVSDFQVGVDYRAVKKSGVKVVWIKATEGLTWNAKLYLEHRANALKAGLRVGAYHFARPDLHPWDPEGEARHFFAVTGVPGPKDLKPILDFETWSPDLTVDQEVAWARAFNREYQKRARIFPAFYTYLSMAQSLKAASPIGNGLWLAAYGANDGTRPKVDAPAPWKKWIAHQYTSNGEVPGVKGRCDVSYVPAHRFAGVLAYGWKGL